MLVRHPPAHCANSRLRRKKRPIKPATAKVYCFLLSQRAKNVAGFAQDDCDGPWSGSQEVTNPLYERGAVSGAPRHHIGGLTPFCSAIARCAAIVPSGFCVPRMKTVAPGLSSAASPGLKVTTGVLGPTAISFSPPL